MVFWRAHDTLNHWNDAGPLEQIHLSRILLEDLGKSETLHGSLALVI